MAGIEETGRPVFGNYRGKSVSAAGSEQHLKTNRERAVEYLNHLKTQFQKPEIQGLVDQVLKLLAESSYADRVESEIIRMKGIAVTSHYINRELGLTLRSKVPFTPWTPSKYQEYSERNLAEIVRGYTPTKKSA